MSDPRQLIRMAENAIERAKDNIDDDGETTNVKYVEVQLRKASRWLAEAAGDYTLEDTLGELITTGKTLSGDHYATAGEWRVVYYHMEGGDSTLRNVAGIGWVVDDDMPESVYAALLAAAKDGDA